jgi:putative membrane protein
MMYWDGSMGGWGYFLMVLSFVLFWGTVITAIILIARSLGAGKERQETGFGMGVADNLLAERFARGEIDETEYTARLTALRRARGA